MRKAIDNVEIKEPPIEELGKKHSCLKRTCATSCGCVLLIIIISLIILKLTLGPKTKEIKDLPPSFAEQIPLYDVEGIEKIQITRGTERNRGAEYIAYIPKLFISPVVLVLDKGNTFIQSSEAIPVTTQDKIQGGWNKFVSFMKTPVADHRDVYMVEWNLLEADPEFIEEYYRNEFERNDFGVGVTNKTQTSRQMTFSKVGVDGVLYIRDEAQTKQTDIVQLTVTLDSKLLETSYGDKRNQKK